MVNKFKVAKSVDSRARSKHKTFEQASRARLQIPSPHRFDYHIFYYDTRYRKYIQV